MYITLVPNAIIILQITNYEKKSSYTGRNNA